MTGYGAAEIKSATQECLVEIKALNNRFCDIYIKNNFSSLEVEQKIEKLIKQNIFRGKINVFIKIGSHRVEDEKVVLNEELADSYYHALKKMKKKITYYGRNFFKFNVANEGHFSGRKNRKNFRVMELNRTTVG